MHDHATDIAAGLVPPVSRLFSGGREATTPPLPRSAECLLVRAIRAALGRTVLWVADGPLSMQEMHRDLLVLTPAGDGADAHVLYAPAIEDLRTLRLPSTGNDVEAERIAHPDPEIAGLRFAALRALLEAAEARDGSARPQPPFIVVTCVQALMQKMEGPDTLRGRAVALGVGDAVGLELLRQGVADAGYEFAAEVAAKGQAAVRGGILDVWPPSEPWPIRIEWFGPRVESIRTFDPADQGSLQRVESVLLSPAVEMGGGEGSILEYLPRDIVVVWSVPGSIEEHAALCESAAVEAEVADRIRPYTEVRRRLIEARHVSHVYVGPEEPDGSVPLPDMRPVPAVFQIPRGIFQPDIMEGARANLLSALVGRAREGCRVVVFMDTQGSLDHFRAALTPVLERHGASGDAAAVETRIGALSEGFVSDALRLVVVAESDLYARRKVLRERYEPQPRPRSEPGYRVSELTDLEYGDLVVHVEHGIGEYRGVSEIVFDGARQEVITIAYADEAKLHVPVSQVHLLTRYSGMGRGAVALHRLGGRRWDGERAAAEKAIRDLASSLLETQAERSLQEGHAFRPDTPWQHEFETAFPYRETPDQQRAIADVKRDMESARPMDRLVCGDAGYGKTEVAVRAAFKAVMEGKQVAVLVPTTVLAQQHYETFQERMSAYPIRIEMLSRFCSRGRHGAIARGLADGSVDIVIGTHALVQPGIAFRDLGLVVIDEEQRFGVEHKERLKNVRRLVDLLTLSATPIPRTLYLSLTGGRDMSLIQTPPRDRIPVETVVARNTDAVVRQAILRELNREGQVFYLHNRVTTIDLIRQRLAGLVPEARVVIGHGQMASSELARVMRDFVACRFDVLLCTTIIESGVDIARANTILIDRADRFGLADLYQLRGRVGRSNRTGYAYLLLPPHGHLDADARKRISAVRKFSSLGAGFGLAMRDLEIRGAGNLLGPQQSGHIAAVGFDLYCQLLRRTMARLKGEPAPAVVDVPIRLDFISLSAGDAGAAVIPYAYIEDESLRLSAYRRVAASAELGEITRIRDELRDRFGPLPPETERLLLVAEIRIAAGERRIQSVEVRRGRFLAMRDGEFLMDGGRFPRLRPGTPDRQLAETLDLVRNVDAWGTAAPPRAPARFGVAGDTDSV